MILLFTILLSSGLLAQDLKISPALVNPSPNVDEGPVGIDPNDDDVMEPETHDQNQSINSVASPVSDIEFNKFIEKERSLIKKIDLDPKAESTILLENSKNKILKQMEISPNLNISSQASGFVTIGWIEFVENETCTDDSEIKEHRKQGLSYFLKAHELDKTNVHTLELILAEPYEKYLLMTPGLGYSFVEKLIDLGIKTANIYILKYDFEREMNVYSSGQSYDTRMLMAQGRINTLSTAISLSTSPTEIADCEIKQGYELLLTQKFTDMTIAKTNMNHVLDSNPSDENKIAALGMLGRIADRECNIDDLKKYINALRHYRAKDEIANVLFLMLEDDVKTNIINTLKSFQAVHGPLSPIVLDSFKKFGSRLIYVSSGRYKNKKMPPFREGIDTAVFGAMYDMMTHIPPKEYNDTSYKLNIWVQGWDGTDTRMALKNLQTLVGKFVAIDLNFKIKADRDYPRDGQHEFNLFGGQRIQGHEAVSYITYHCISTTKIPPHQNTVVLGKIKGFELGKNGFGKTIIIPIVNVLAIGCSSPGLDSELILNP